MTLASNIAFLLRLFLLLVCCQLVEVDYRCSSSYGESLDVRGRPTNISDQEIAVTANMSNVHCIIRRMSKRKFCDVQDDHGCYYRCGPSGSFDENIKTSPQFPICEAKCETRKILQELSVFQKPMIEVCLFAPDLIAGASKI